MPRSGVWAAVAVMMVACGNMDPIEIKQTNRGTYPGSVLEVGSGTAGQAATSATNPGAGSDFRGSGGAAGDGNWHGGFAVGAVGTTAGLGAGLDAKVGSNATGGQSWSDQVHAGTAGAAFANPAEGVAGSVETGTIDSCYVDAAASERGDGTRARPFRTITRALATIDESTSRSISDASRRPSIVVRSGTYDEALGERFPLDIRGLRLVGAGLTSTRIVGRGEAGKVYLPSWRYEDLLNTEATLIVGDEQAPTTIRGLAVHTGLATLPNSIASIGILCDRGRGDHQAYLMADGTPPGVTTIEDVRVEPGYSYGIAAVAAVATACNLRLRASSIDGALVGLYATGHASDLQYSPVVLEIGGDNPDDRNTFSGIPKQSISIQSYVSRARIVNNLFIRGDEGIVIQTQTGGVVRAQIVSNRFENLTGHGVTIFDAPPIIEVFDNNEFANLKSAERPAKAVRMYLYSTPDTPVIKARGNLIQDADTGVEIHSLIGSALPNRAPLFDWGTESSPGRNVILCNSHSGEQGGHDVLLDAQAATQATFVGNTWNHSPPTVFTLLGEGDQDDVRDHSAGMDVVVRSSDATLNQDWATRTEAAWMSQSSGNTCPSSRRTGPALNQ